VIRRPARLADSLQLAREQAGRRLAWPEQRVLEAGRARVDDKNGDHRERDGTHQSAVPPRFSPGRGAIRHGKVTWSEQEISSQLEEAGTSIEAKSAVFPGETDPAGLACGLR
jgi:hypothetical protein